MSARLVIGLCVLFGTVVPAQGQWGKWLRGILGDQPTAEETRLGLKEALEIGTQNAVRETGRLDGYLKNEAIKILLPGSVRKIESGLRFAGLGDDLDNFIVGMNRAAEQAAPQARDIFLEAIRSITIQDAYGILRGGDTAATDYFREQTGASLSSAFLPIIRKSLSEVGVTRQFQELGARVRRIPLINLESIDLDQYVVDQALDGLFHVLAEEEKKIRTNPAARVTDLLKKVFGDI